LNPELYQVEQLDPARHDRGQFTCESEPLTRYLRERARKESAAKATACFVIVPRSAPRRIAGYYTLSAANVLFAQLPARLAKSQPRYTHLPATLLGRLARDNTFKGAGIGGLLMMSVFTRVCASSQEIGSVALVTDPKDEKARQFYERYGFESLDERRLILPIQDVCAWANQRPIA
jgi:ribosomal protein S18 acetylase RimI-like enzyme